MLGQIKKKSLIFGAARCFSTVTRKEVMISQSRDLLSNTALEDWMAKNLNLKEKSVLILSNNITLNNTAEIKATLLDENTYWRTKEFNSLVLSSISSDLPLAKIPDFNEFEGMLEPFGTNYSIHLELTNVVETKDVLKTLEKIGWKFLNEDLYETNYECPTHLSLVRPDDGWFPGLETIRRDLEFNTRDRMEEGNTGPGHIEIGLSNAVRDDNKTVPLQTSFGFGAGV